MASITIFSKQIRILDGLYSLNDLHKAAGDDESRYQPTFFIRTKQTQELISEIQSAYSQSAVKSINGGKERGTWVCKELVYAYAMWISAKFHLHVIRAFDQLSLSSNSFSNKENQTTTKMLKKSMQALANKRSKHNTYVENHKINDEVKGYLGVSKLDDATPAQLEKGLVFIQTAIEGEYLGRSEAPTDEYIASMERRISYYEKQMKLIHCHSTLMTAEFTETVFPALRVLNSSLYGNTREHLHVVHMYSKVY